MPRRNRSKTMKGGLFDFGESSWSSWNPFKKSTTQPVMQSQPAMQPVMQPQPVMQSQPVSNYSTVTGGKHKSKRRHMKGGYTSNVPTMSVASHAAPISGVANAQPQAWVGKGGRRTRRRNKRYNKSYRKH